MTQSPYNIVILLSKCWTAIGWKWVIWKTTETQCLITYQYLRSDWLTFIWPTGQCHKMAVCT